ncbi:MAG: hypothetical protein ACE5I1_05625, partial [bacterium]
GSLTSRRAFNPSIEHIRLLVIIFGILLPVDVVFIRAIRPLAGAAAGAYLSFGTQTIALLIAVVPMSFLSGILFQWTARIFVARKNTLAKAYAIESLGGLVGGAGSTFLLQAGVQNFVSAILCALIAIGLALAHRLGKRKLRANIAVFGLLAILLALIWKGASIDHIMTAWNHPHLVETKDSPYGRVTISVLSGQVSVFENDALLFDSESIAAESLVHLAALQHDSARKALILGAGFDGSIRELLKHPIRKVDYVEVDRTIVDMIRRHSPDAITRVLDGQKARLIFDDPRNYLERKNKYDIILAGMPEPSSGQTNRYYTKEFFEHCSVRMNPGGILAFRLHSSENLWTTQLKLKTVSIYRALESVFENVLVLPGATNIVIASHTPLTRGPVVLSQRLAERKIAASLITTEYIHYLFTNDRFFRIAEILRTAKAPMNTDARPICYQFTIAIWLSKFFPEIAHFDFSLPQTNENNIYKFWWAFPAVLATIFLIRRKATARRVILVSVAGFLGIVFEAQVILYYQVKSGILYQDIGILLMAFMAGLSAGSFVVNNLRKQNHNLYMISRWVGAGLLLGFVLLNLFFAWQIDSGFSPGLVYSFALLAIAGFLSSGIFAYVSLDRIADQSTVISPLYAVDLLGGCLGALLATLILIPMLGLQMTALFLTGVAIVTILLL